MYNEWFLHMSKMLQKDVSFFLKVQMVHTNLLQPFTCLQPYLYEIYKIWKYVNQ